jgi:hypothetical protein
VTAESPGDAAATVQRTYRRLFAREPSENELRLGIEFLSNDATGKPFAKRAEQYAQALLGSNEFLFVD